MVNNVRYSNRFAANIDGRNEGKTEVIDSVRFAQSLVDYEQNEEFPLERLNYISSSSKMHTPQLKEFFGESPFLQHIFYCDVHPLVAATGKIQRPALFEDMTIHRDGVFSVHKLYQIIETELDEAAAQARQFNEMSDSGRAVDFYTTQIISSFLDAIGEREPDEVFEIPMKFESSTNVIWDGTYWDGKPFR